MHRMRVMPEGSRDARAAVTVRRFASHAEAERDERAYWARLSPAARVLLAWRLSEMQWRLRAEGDDATGLRRSVTRLHRR